MQNGTVNAIRQASKALWQVFLDMGFNSQPHLAGVTLSRRAATTRAARLLTPPIPKFVHAVPVHSQNECMQTSTQKVHTKRTVRIRVQRRQREGAR
eukprot:354470-Chlamydomonas_euryale.AAC.13